MSPDGTTAYIGSYDKHMYAIDIETGAVNWKNTAGSSLIGIESSPAVNANNLVVVGSYDHHIWCYNGTTGKVVWKYKTNGYVASAPALSESDGGQTVYIGSVDGFVYALAMQTGRLQWKYNATGQAVWAPVAVSHGVVYFGSGGEADPTTDKHARLNAVNASTGEQLMNVYLGHQIQSCPSANSNGVVFIGNYDGCVYAVQSSNSSIRWKTCTGGRVESSVAVFTTACGVEMVVVGSGDGFVYGISTDGGTIVWQTKVGQEVGSSPAVDREGRVYIGGDPGLYCINGTNGKVVWMYETTGLIGSSPAVLEDGSLLFGGEDGWLYKIH